MSLLNIVILSLVQGITEFLPISSSGHLILVPAVTGAADQGLLIDVAVHVGTLGAVALYFRRDLVDMLNGLLQLARGRWTPGGRLALTLVLATIPVVVVGFLAKDLISASLRSVTVVAWATIGFGVLLYVADRMGMTTRRIEDVGGGHAIVLGLAQVLALIPGTSRSGITMTAARMLGYGRAEAARYSMLMSIPVIAGAGVVLGADVTRAGDWAVGRDVLLALVLSFVAALIAIAFLMRWLRAAGFAPFVAYRLLLGAALLIWVYS